MPENDLELVIREKIRPMLDKATENLIGAGINKLTDDITSKIDGAHILDIDIDFEAGYRQAKNKFRKSYLTRLLLLNLGNISEAAKIAGMDRRSLHRMISGLGIDVQKIKKKLLKPYYLKVGAVSHIIEDVLGNYKRVIHPDKLKNIYSNVESISENIVKELPELNISLKDAEKEFEKAFFGRALEKENGNKAKAAKRIGLRYETLHRKMKALLFA